MHANTGIGSPACEILIDGALNAKARKMMRAMVDAADSAGISIEVNDAYCGHLPWLMLYGVGHLERGPWFAAHVANGGRAIGWDLGYFGRRQAGSFPMRLTIDAPHPQRLLHDRPSERWDSASIALRNEYCAEGPIVLCGTGAKSRRAAQQAGPQWEVETLATIKRAYPGRRIIYRPKGGANEILPGAETIAHGEIEPIIRGASLVVVKHSNVAVDACIAGVPVVCQDGAAAALYGSDLMQPKNPGYAERLRFLRQLAWWQWRAEEASQCWQFIRDTISNAPRPAIQH